MDPAFQASPETELSRIEALLAQGPQSLELRCIYASLLKRLGRREDAKLAYLEILKLDSTHLGALSGMGALLYETDYRKAAISVYKRIIELYPHEAAGHVNLANVLWHHNDHPGAARHYHAALEIDPNCNEAHQGMAAVLMERREIDAAWGHAKQGFSTTPVQVIPFQGIGNGCSLLILNSVLGGNIPLRSVIDNRIFKTSILATEFYDPHLPLPEHQLVINAIGDADRCPEALQIAARLLQGTQVPVINPPEKVALTGRAENARRLAAIPGLRTPGTILLHREELEGAKGLTRIASLGFEFPLLLRVQGFHAGQHFVKIDHEEDLAASLAGLPGQELALIQFLDARSLDGKCRKYRVMMIDGKLYPLHLAVSKNWKIHYFSADMSDNAEHRAEDFAFLSGMSGVLGAQAMATLQELDQVLDLDYAGVDFSINQAGELLLFEANTTMIIALPPSDEKWAYRRAPVQKVLDAVTAMLLSRVETLP